MLPLTIFYSCTRSLLQSYSYLLLTLNSTQQFTIQQWPLLEKWAHNVIHSNRHKSYRHNYCTDIISIFFTYLLRMRLLSDISKYIVIENNWPTTVMYLFPWASKVMHTLVNCVPCYHKLSLGSSCTVNVDDHSHLTWSLSVFAFLFLG